MTSVVVVVICAIVKDEPDLLEWVAYHRLLGVDHFYIYDNGSTDPPLTTTPWPDLVTVYPWAHGAQNDAYDDFIFNKRVVCDWAAFIDGDEYIVLRRGGGDGGGDNNNNNNNNNNIQTFLQGYTGADSVGLAWLVFDSNGHRERPTDTGGTLVVEAYTRRLRDTDGTLKRIVRPDRVRAVPGAHMRAHCVSLDRRVADHRFKDVNTLGDPIRGVRTENALQTTRVACIHHYYTRSLADWRRRLRRGQVRKGSRQKTEAAFWTVEHRPDKVHDVTLAGNANLVKRMKEFLASSPSLYSPPPLSAGSRPLVSPLRSPTAPDDGAAAQE